LNVHCEEIVPIILAAGSSKYLAFPKPVAKFGGKTALQLAIENCEGLSQGIVVLGCDAGKIRSAVPGGVRVVLNRRWREGQMSSLRCALDDAPSGCAFMIYPVDHVLLHKRTVQTLVAAFCKRREGIELVVPRHNQRFGHPIIVAATLRHEFFFAETARQIVYRDPSRNLVVQVRTSAIYEDFDAPQSYRRCLRRFLSGH
jgi:CTP:molybdopterin cytidylyltransferase MocA